MSELKLTIELVPSTSWGNNLRSVMTSKQWNALSGIVCDRAWGICQICGGVGTSHAVECHEIWHYNEKTLVQKLVGMIALCPNCHRVKHMGYARVIGKYEEAVKHFMKVNGLKRKEADLHIEEAFSLHRERSNWDWTLDLSLLKRYGIDPDKLENPDA